METFDSISPLDGRYKEDVGTLLPFFGEKALMSYRILVESEYFIALSEQPDIKLREFSTLEKNIIRELHNISDEDFQIIKAIEKTGYENIKATNHDVKAVEYFMKKKLEETTLNDSLEMIHFALTSEDINNLAYANMLKDSLNNIIMPKLDAVYEAILEKSQKYEFIPMLARTHGQPASPTTVGKEFYVFASRLREELGFVKKAEINAKLNGATGNYNAHIAAYPDIEWTSFSVDFISSFNKEDDSVKLKPNLITTQINPHDSYARIFDSFKRINNILLDFDQDMWRYISDDWFKQKIVRGEVGSSTMPHKVNPIDFENSEGNLGLANSLFNYFSSKLPISRLQRDLSDSTVFRNIGVAFGHSLLGYNSLLKGLGKIDVNEEQIRSSLEEHPEVIAEGIQTILRREGADMPYEKLKELTHGKEVTLKDLRRFIKSLDVPRSVKKELLELTPENYTGLAEELVP